MKYSVYFNTDFLEEFDSLEEAVQYRLEQLEIEGWEDESGSESDQYFIERN